MKILIVKLSAIGDVIHTLPALTTLRRHYPDAQIDWLVESAAADLVQGHAAVNRVLIWRRREFAKRIKAGELPSAGRLFSSLLRQLRETRYDLILDFQALLKSSLWIFLAKGLRKAGFGPGMEHSESSHLFLNERIPAISMEVHALDRGLRLLQSLGIPSPEILYDLPIGKRDEDEAKDLVAAGGVRPDQPLVAINPVAKWPTKLWTPNRFEELARRLVEKGFQVVFTGSGEDLPLIDEMAGPLGSSVVRLEGKTSLKVLAALYRSASTVVSTDTGPMHLAAAVGTPVVALFGPTAPWRTGPYGKGHVVLRSGVSCSPCFSRSCKTTELEPMACMNRITVDQVMEGVSRVCAERKSGAGQSGLG
ncbi:MAG: lipopolysaccharide heptosyltransferase I [Desulfobacterota bacterium]|jgi:3-deoxy-D-manno-octulosonic-acid transferase/heptosyltransferase-1|nr:lipopolysaccharide heptosyltransferase I [Thermodesulfobacteriota bacterium]